MNINAIFRDFDQMMIKHGFTPMGGNVSLRSELELADIYGRENVRVHEGRLQVQEERFTSGARALEWVEADNALPPPDPSDMPPEEPVTELTDIFPEDNETQGDDSEDQVG